MSLDVSETIPTLTVVHSSPKLEKGKFKTSSYSESLDNDLHNEFSFKRKAPVTKKHKIKKETSLLKSKSSSGSAPQRKGSNPIMKPSSASFQDKSTKLYKSNSFFKETEKNKVGKHSSDCSDIDEPSDGFRLSSCGNSPFQSSGNQDVDVNGAKVNNEAPAVIDLQIIDSRRVVYEKKSAKFNRYQSESSSSDNTNLTRNLSISLNTLHI